MKRTLCLIMIQFFIGHNANAEQALQCPYDYSPNSCELILEKTCRYSSPVEVQFIANLFTWGHNWSMIERVTKGKVYKALGVHTFLVKYLNSGTENTINKIIIHDDKSEVSEFLTTYLKTFSIFKSKFTECEQ